MTERIAFFGYEELEDDVHRKAKVGGKGANLLELTEQGFPVPEGFVITTDAYREFLREGGIQDQLETYEDLDVEDSEEIEAFRESVDQLMTTTPLPDSIRADIKDAYTVIEGDPVAVRSSATAEDLPDASFAGQLETYLNVQGPDNVIEAVRKCWASVFTRRAITYRSEKGYDIIDVDIAVVVQRMIPAEKSGVLFTVDPETGEDETIIEASWGLGESIVGGEVSPDQYTLRDGVVTNEVVNEKEVMYEKDSSSGDTVKVDVPPDRQRQRVLTDEDLSNLYEVSEKISAGFEQPQDIEWAIADGEIYLLQTRPITTISERKPESGDAVKGRPLAEGLGVSGGTAEGRICLTPIQAVKRDKQGQDVIMVRRQTSPSDMHGMKSANGILTSQGGTTSHAAIVARELEKPAVVGCNQVDIDLENDCVRIAGEIFEEGERISIDGDRGVVLQPETNTES